MRRRWIVGASLLAVVLAGCASRNKRLTAPVQPPTVVTAALQGQGEIARLRAVQVEATVVSVDARRRRVTLRGSDGKIESFRVGSEVRDLSRVRRGDRVVATYTEAVAMRLVRKGAARPEAVDDVVFDRGPAGALPSESGAQVTTVVARIVGIDREDRELVLRGPDGKHTTIEVDDPARLEHVKVGDLIEATFVEGLTIAVERTGVRGR